MALYRYVDDRGQLERWVVERVLSRVDLALPEGLPWAGRIELLLDRARAAVVTHPAVVPLVLTHRHAAPSSLRLIETMLAVLTEAGFTGTDRVVAQRALIGHLLGTLLLDHLGPLPGDGTETMAALPDDAFPHLAATAAHARQVAPADEFRLGLAALLRGLRPGSD
ncbi:TetR/AcrR family transcriptional regulator C-terminal domain-containing protein [Micromonospora zhanjiangensis]